MMLIKSDNASKEELGWCVYGQYMWSLNSALYISQSGRQKGVKLNYHMMQTGIVTEPDFDTMLYSVR